MGNIERKWVPVPLAKHLVLDGKMYWNDFDSQFVIPVMDHGFVKSMVRNVAHRPPARELIRDEYAT
jgi:hypothetical protein